jgi:phospho-N-acetylmuramoyl-pentapeptide-transferase
MQNVVLALGFLFFSFIVTSLLIVPFINALYKLKFLRAKQKTVDAFGKKTPIFDKFHAKKAGTPVGGGLLVIAITSLLFVIFLPIANLFGANLTSNYNNMNDEVFIILFTFLSFGLLGLYDDAKKLFNFKRTKFFGLKMRYKLSIQIILALVISSFLYFKLNIDFINIPFLGSLNLGFGYIFIATFLIVAFTNAVNITDGLDGLATGSLLFSLFGLWFLTASNAIMDMPMSIFIGLWIGSLISFLYFNTYPARIFLGDVGALSFGATLAVIGLLLGNAVSLAVIGFIFVLEVSTSFFQLISKKFLKRKLFKAAPLHLALQEYGWSEPKIVARAWLVQILLTLFGLWLGLIN